MTERQPWNSSTRLRARREDARPRKRQSPTCRRRKTDETQPSANPTRAMIEKAVDSAVARAMQDEGQTKPFSSVTDAETLVRTLQEVDEEAEAWRERYSRGRQQRHQDAMADADKHAQLTSARLQYEQRKLALRSLRAQVEREIESLRATSEDLMRRESLMDEAFERFRRHLEERGTRKHQNVRAEE